MQDLWIFITPMVVFGFPFAAWAYVHTLRSRERSRSRESYIRLLDRRLDLIQSAITMGMPKEDIAALDDRLEQLIGRAQFATIADLKGAALEPGALSVRPKSRSAQL